MELPRLDRYLHSALVLVSLLLGTHAWCYPTPVDFEGELLRWNIDRDNAIVTYEIVSSEPTNIDFFGPLVHEAAQMWNDVPTSYLTYEPATEDETAMVTIHLDSSLSDAPYSSGYAVFDESSDDGPVHCKIRMLVDFNISFTSMSKTALHEMGHCFGLGHSLVPESIMSYRNDKNSFALDTDDIAAVSRLYPADGSTPQKPPGCAISGRATSRIWIVVLLLTPIALVLRPKKSWGPQAI